MHIILNKNIRYPNNISEYTINDINDCLIKIKQNISWIIFDLTINEDMYILEKCSKTNEYK